MNPWDTGPPDNRRTQIIGWIFVIGVTLILAAYLTAADRAKDRERPPAPTPAVSR